eukprot:TRINITY_DN3572_c0_g1_i1.p1 TRINITY_DN3572_c0_g1~~TRINITY_DN3572_c0_g1_i1.p1  ORF type:complete len:496 (+),score=141.69 TRINITY_DN3572_c0_g1_i1:64-1551(+)
MSADQKTADKATPQDMEMQSSKHPETVQHVSPKSAQHKGVAMRYLITFLLAVVNTFCYTDRTNISVAVLEFGYSSSNQGYILSAFFYGYLCTQLIGGWATNKFGPKWVLIIGIIIWTAGDVLTIPTYDNFSALIAMRVLMGLGEGVNYPCVHHLASAWFPENEKSSLMTIVSSGMDFGSIISILVAPKIIAGIGWRYIFVIFGALNISWALFFSILGASGPDESRWISKEEEHHIVSHRRFSEVHNMQHAPHKIPWKQLLTNKGAIAVYISHFCFNYSWYVLLGWIPTFYIQKLGYNLKHDSSMAALPYICGAVAANASGRIADALINKLGWSVTTTRKIMNSIGLFGPAISLCVVSFVTTKEAAVALLSLTLFMGRFGVAGYWTNMLDIAPRNAGQMMAISNSFATIPGIAGNSITGAILTSTGSWTIVFMIAAALNFVGGVTYLFMGTGEAQILYEEDNRNESQVNTEHVPEQPEAQKDVPQVADAPTAKPSA